MEISASLIQLALVLVPGAVAALIIAALAFHKRISNVEFVFIASVISILSYAILELFLAPGTASILRAIATGFNTNPPPEINLIHILYSTLISIGLGLAVSFAINYKLIFRVAKLFRISNKYGDEALYMFYLNIKQINFVNFIDIENDTIYSGTIKMFDISGDYVEVVLGNVTIYSYEDARVLGEVSSVYLKRLGSKIVLQEPDVKDDL